MIIDSSVVTVIPSELYSPLRPVCRLSAVTRIALGLAAVMTMALARTGSGQTAFMKKYITSGAIKKRSAVSRYMLLSPIAFRSFTFPSDEPTKSIDIGNVLGTKVKSDFDYSEVIWFGKAINKAMTICHECNRPYFVGVSGTIYNHLDENLKVTTKRIIGIKKQVELWNRLSYQFENEKKHLYQTNFHKTFEEGEE